VPICPICKEEIDHLIATKKEIIEERMWFTDKKNPYPNWEELDTIDIVELDFKCPICKEVLFENYYEAIAFLKGHYRPRFCPNCAGNSFILTSIKSYETYFEVWYYCKKCDTTFVIVEFYSDKKEDKKKRRKKNGT